MGLVDTFPDKYLPRAPGGALETQDHLHRIVHDGAFFSADYEITHGATTAGTVLITAPATGVYHMYFNVETNKAGAWTFSEAPNATATAGSTLTAYNNNRQSTESGGLTLIKQGTYTSSGTVLTSHILGSETGGPQTVGIGGASGSMNFRILNVSTAYLLRHVPAETATSILHVYYYLGD